MSSTWWAYRRLGKFLIKLDVITYEQLKRFLDAGDWPRADLT
jgi:hypothetical protein